MQIDLPPELHGLYFALLAIGQVMHDGARTHPFDDWNDRPVDYHIGRAVRHIRLYNEGDESEPHLRHAATRLLMAIELAERNSPLRK
jgi:hypothetical protein